MVRRLKWFFHPIFVFIFSILALALSLFLYIYWYMEVSTGMRTLVHRYNLDRQQFLEARTWLVILVLSILVGIILAGVLIIFVYSQKVARLNRLQRDFINNFTHELKTPVTSLKLYLETFHRHALSRADQLKYIDYMLHDVNNLADNIGRILNLARIETKTYSREFVLCDLEETIRRFLGNNGHLFADCNIQVSNPSGRHFYYEINPPFFEMLLMNILNNGLKYNDNDKPELQITINTTGKQLQIRFTDNGMGIAKGERKKIFRKFYQSRQRENFSPRGSGLGLYLVQSIARMHKGKVTAENRPDRKGACFTLSLPFRHEEGE